MQDKTTERKTGQTLVIQDSTGKGLGCVCIEELLFKEGETGTLPKRSLLGKYLGAKLCGYGI